ncbi:YpjP family protein [Paenisporosarcina cavernae]|uniref:YpjP-like protein n=1 Tax=Paenisporosarcina cavernae TaxID=2320858 RepID=A0A385YVB9_9BACL|nr:YpjP family protein [Paenisporosarcina cavernae]AYC29443.1 hypothetical protein D3873_05920 [Paenisporosarcina cavernae]
MKMKLTKFFTVLVAIITFGMVSPDHDLWDSFLDQKEEKQVQSSETKADFATSVYSLAKEQSDIKFGTRIGPVIKEDYYEMIFPKMEEAIQMTYASLHTDQTIQWKVSENPAGGSSEKIFHIYNERTREDLIRFHVRTDLRPKDGYYFNFHYHTWEDNFVSHIDMGEIYWSKNQPPKWLS